MDTPNTPTSPCDDVDDNNSLCLSSPKHSAELNTSSTITEHENSISSDDCVVITLKRDLIPNANDATLNDLDKDKLKCFNVTSYQHSIYEQNLINQVEKNIANLRHDEEDSPIDRHKTNEDDYICDDIIQQSVVQQSNYPSLSEDSIFFGDDDADCFDDDVDRFIQAPGTDYLKKLYPNYRSSSANNLAKAQKIYDDGNKQMYKKRIEEYNKNKGIDFHENLVTIEEPDFKIPKQIYDLLFEHQKTSLIWLWHLHLNMQGGILADEMGLGKTIQIISFLTALKYSKFSIGYYDDEQKKSLGPVILICPTTVLFNWVYEFHLWSPEFRVAVLHYSGTFTGSKDQLIKEILKDNGILITSYDSLINHAKLTEFDWHYVILDEGHKIRNPDIKITQICKQFKTPHRLLLSGTPIQNDLKELWSLIDFVYPGRLGILKDFMTTVAMPIKRGGYYNANQMELDQSLTKSNELRNLISPILLRRTKHDIQQNLKLPAKNEQVLFCKLTEEQQKKYIEFINSGIISKIRDGGPYRHFNLMIFKYLIQLRKICNHPYLFTKESHHFSENDLEFYMQSSKMTVLDELLKLWKTQNHRVLIFTQGIQMLNLLENYVKIKQYRYYRMDGKTTTLVRSKLVQSFNQDNDVFLFLLSTKVGGVGVSLIGANRVIIYDPDWNPFTDVQARERSWRIGQKKDVLIYRLMTSGTIEEKIYQRQIFKQYLSNRVLNNPKQKRFVKDNDLRELFTLNDCNESELYFYDAKAKIEKKNKQQQQQQQSNMFYKKNDQNNSNLPKIPKKPGTNSQCSKNEKQSLINWSNVKIEISEERKKELRELVKNICKKFDTPDSDKNENENNDQTDKQNEITQMSATRKRKFDCLKSDDSEPVNYVIDNDPGKKMTVKILSKKDDTKKFKKFKKFEGKRIQYLVKKEIYNEDQDDNFQKTENDLLAKLLSKTKVDTILQQDKIENVNVPDHYFIDRDTKQFIQRALIQLTKDVQQARQFKKNHISCSNEPDKKPSNPYQSSSIIENLLNLDFENSNYDQNIFKNPTSNPYSIDQAIEGKKPKKEKSEKLTDMEMVKEMHRFLTDNERKGRPISTDKLCKHFRNRIEPLQNPKMKAILYNIANKCSDPNHPGEFIWKLKTEFKLN